METSPKLSKADSVQADQAVAGRNGSELFSVPSYARDLRVVGQLLESHNVVTADLVMVTDTYIIQGKVKSTRRSSLMVSFLRNWAKEVSSGFPADTSRQNTRPGLVILRCKLEDVSGLDARARNRRSRANEMPNPYALSQILRSAGAYLDTRKRSSLIGMLVRERDLTIRFETGEGRLEETRQDIDYFYDYWVKMYLRRNKRSHLDPFKDRFPSSLWKDVLRG